MAASVKFLGVEFTHGGEVSFGIEVTKNDGTKYQRQWKIPAKDAEAITSAADPATAFETYVTEHWSSPPSWASTAVGTTISV